MGLKTIAAADTGRFVSGESGKELVENVLQRGFWEKSMRSPITCDIAMLNELITRRKGSRG